MQRPRLRKTRCSAAAAELERQKGCERKKTLETGRMRKDWVMAIYKGKTDKWARKTRRLKIWLSSYQDALILGMVIKIRIC